MLQSFSISEIPQSLFDQNCNIAREWFKQGKLPTYSNDICGNLTAGYGRLDYHGYFEYSLVVKNDKVII